MTTPATAMPVAIVHLIMRDSSAFIRASTKSVVATCTLTSISCFMAPFNSLFVGELPKYTLDSPEWLQAMYGNEADGTVF